jgi:membrane protease YdiL (CAAX protease family)
MDPADDLPLQEVAARLFRYVLAVAPSAVTLAGLGALLPQSLTGARVVLHLASFIMLRDAMTPHGLWSIEAGWGPLVTIRLLASVPGLLALAAMTATLIAALLRYEPLTYDVAWRKPGMSTLRTAVVGMAGAALIAAPVVALSRLLSTPGTDAASSTVAKVGSGLIPASRAPALAVFALVGNAYEELLFRGVLQGYLEREERVKAGRAALLSALAFAAGHIFLATAVTQVGWPLLAFTFYEGYLCATLRTHYGLAAAALAHGGGIFLLAAGLDA